MNQVLDAWEWSWRQHTEPRTKPAKLPGTESAKRSPEVSGVGTESMGAWEESNFNLVCGGHVSSFSGGDIGGTELGLICTWVKRGGGRDVPEGSTTGAKAQRWNL